MFEYETGNTKHFCPIESQTSEFRDPYLIMNRGTRYQNISIATNSQNEEQNFGIKNQGTISINNYWPP